MEQLYRALLYPPMWGGIPRAALVCIWGGVFLVYIKKHTLFVALVGLAFHIAVAVCLQQDKQFFTVLWRHIQDRDFWRA